MNDIEDDDLDFIVDEKPKSLLTFDLTGIKIPSNIRLDDPYPQVTEQQFVEPPFNKSEYSFGGQSKTLFMSKEQTLKGSSKKKAFAFSFAADPDVEKSGSAIFNSDNKASFRGTFGIASSDNENSKNQGKVLNYVVKEEKNQNDEGSEGITLIDLNSQKKPEQEQDDDKLPSFGNSAYDPDKNSTPLMNSVLNLNIPNAPVTIPKFKPPSQTSQKKSSQSSVHTSGNSINKSQTGIDKSQLNFVIPEAVKINMEEKIKRSQFSAEEKQIESEEVERQIASDDQKYHEASVEIDKSSLHQSYASQEQEERITGIQIILKDKILLEVKSTRTTYSKTINANSIKLLEDYFESEFKTLLPMTAPQIFSKPINTLKVYLDQLFNFLSREYQPFFVAYLKNSPQIPETQTTQQKNWWSQAWNYGSSIINQIQKAPQSKLQKLHKFVESRISSSQRCLKARETITQTTSVQIEPCPAETGGQLNVHKVFCLSQWMIALSRSEKYLIDQKTKLATDVKNKAQFDMYNKMAKNYLVVMVKQMNNTQMELQTMVRQLLIE